MDLFRRPASAVIHPADWSQAPKFTKALAVGAMFLIMVGVYLVYLSGTVFEIQGPVRIAANASNTILIGAYNRLFLVDSEKRLSKLNAADVGLSGPISSITVDGDHWILGDDSSGLLYRCAGDLSRCKPLFDERTDMRLFSRAHGVAFLDDKLIVSDSERHRLRVFDKSGHEVRTTRTAPIELCYPNQVIAVDGFLYVTDTNNFRIARVDPTQNYRSETFIRTAGGQPLTSANCADLSSRIAKRGDAYANLMLDTTVTVGRPSLSPARPQRILPASLLHSHRDDWWVVQMKGKMTQGDVILYASDGHPTRRVALPDDSDPTDMVETPDGVLITDPTLSRIYDVALDGTLRGEWGSAELKVELNEILKTRARWQLFEPLGWAAIVLGLLFGVTVIVRELMRVKGDWNPHVFKLTPVDVLPQSLNAPEVWLAVRPEFSKRAKKLAWFIGAAGILLCALEGLSVISLFDASSIKNPLLAQRVLLLFYCFVVACALAFLVVARAIYRSEHRRIGTNGRQLLFDAGNGAVIFCDVEHVLVSGRTLLLGKHFVNVYTQYRQSIYPMNELQSLVLARIPRSNFVRPLSFSYAALRRGNGFAWTTVVVIVIVLASEPFSAWFPDQATVLKHSLLSWLSR